MGRLKTMKRSNKRGDIMQAAMELIVEKGFHGAPMDEIARNAGVGTGTIYIYFESKQVLITELYQELEEKIMLTIQDGYPFGMTIRKRYFHIATALLRFFVAYPLSFRYVEQFYNSPYGISLRRDRIMGNSGKMKVFADLFEDGVTQQVLKDYPTFVIIALAFSPLYAVARDHTFGFIILDDTSIRKAVGACWNAIKR
jgi:AcrR family transcriptional regulator